MKKMALFLWAFLLIVSCSEKPKEMTDKEKIEKGIVGNYVYLDTDGTLHADRECFEIGDIASEIKKSSALRRVPLNELTKAMLDNCCNRCINDVMFDNLKQLCINNGNYVDEYETDSIASDSLSL